MLVYPTEEEEFEVQGGEGLADHVHGGNGEVVVESVLAAFVGGFLDDGAGFGDGVEAAGHDLLRLFGVMGGDGSELGDVEDLKGAAAQGGGGVDGGAVGNFTSDWVKAVPFISSLIIFDGGEEAQPSAGASGGSREVKKAAVLHFVHFLSALPGLVGR